jgi:hypothetical protein
MNDPGTGSAESGSADLPETRCDKHQGAFGTTMSGCGTVNSRQRAIPSLAARWKAGPETWSNPGYVGLDEYGRENAQATLAALGELHSERF